MINEQKNYIGLDWGAAKVGVALGHAETRIALAYTTFKNDENLSTHIGALLEKEDIGTVVLGVHKSDTFVGEHEAEKFGQRLGEKFGMIVAYHDEMFTSKMAQAAMIAQGEKHVSTHDDAEAARIILQSWLDRKNSF